MYAETYEFEGTSVRLISAESTAPADGKTAIKFTVEFFGYKCTDPDWRGVYILYPQPEFCNDAIGTDYGPVTGTVARTNADSPFSGNATTTGTINSNGFSGNMTGGTSIGHPHHQVIYPGPDGRITLNLTSTVAETKHIHVDNGNTSDPNSIEFDVTFTAIPGAAPQPPADPNAPPPSSALGSTPKFIPAAQPAIAADTESILKTATISVNQQPVTQSGQKPQLTQGEEIVISGVAVPNALVTLYIFSDPQVVKLTADTSGNWSHTITGLAVGDHHIESEVLDPLTFTQTKRVNLVSFRIVGHEGQASREAGDSMLTTSKIPAIGIAVSALIMALGISFILSRHHAFAHIFRKNAAVKARPAVKSRKQ